MKSNNGGEAGGAIETAVCGFFPMAIAAFIGMTMTMSVFSIKWLRIIKRSCQFINVTNISSNLLGSINVGIYQHFSQLLSIFSSF